MTNLNNDRVRNAISVISGILVISDNTQIMEQDYFLSITDSELQINDISLGKIQSTKTSFNLAQSIFTLSKMEVINYTSVENIDLITLSS